MWGPEAGPIADSKARHGYGGRDSPESRFPERPPQGPGENYVKLRSPLLTLLILAFISLFFLNTWQGNRYQRLERGVQRLEQEQKNWLEQNKKVIAALAVLSSPVRIKTLAEESLGLKPLQAEDLIEIELGDAEID
jgi:hypothetical protein